MEETLLLSEFHSALLLYLAFRDGELGAGCRAMSAWAVAPPTHLCSSACRSHCAAWVSTVVRTIRGSSEYHRGYREGWSLSSCTWYRAGEVMVEVPSSDWLVRYR